MLHVILTILKILGIIIAIILGLLLLILLSVLFVPLRYKVKAKKYEKITGFIRLNWLLHIVSIYIAYSNDELIYKIKIFGFTVMNSLKDDSNDETDDTDGNNIIVEEKVKKVKEKHKKLKKKLKVEYSYAHITDDYIYTINDDDDDDDDNDNKIDVTVQAQSIGDSDIKSDTDSEVSKKTKEKAIESIREKTSDTNSKVIENTSKKARKITSRKASKKVISNIYKRICHSLHIVENITKKIKTIFLRIRDTIVKIFNKIISLKDSIAEKIQYFNENINTEENRILLKFLISQVKIILKHIAPRKYKIYVKYGADEPDVTGKVISYVAIANAFFNLNLNFVPVFDEQVLEGEIYLRGRIRVFTMLIIAFRVYRNKQFKKMIKKFK